ncbi:MAG TPA: hydrogenase maturation protease [Nitrososphaerales archaeon]|nr:hydrogenase maturation protease [Nitrososphaerales archaeon]
MGSTPAEATHAYPTDTSLAQPSEDWERTAQSWMREPGGGKVHFVGVGNPIRQDDAIGLEIVSSLRKKLGPNPSPNVVIHQPSLMPERLLSKVAATGDRVVIFDAVEANRTPGAVVCASLADTKFGFFATHNVPLRLIPGVAGNLGRSFVVGVQPESLEVGEGLSATARAAKGRIVEAMGAMIGGMGNGHL